MHNEHAFFTHESYSDAIKIKTGEHLLSKVQTTPWWICL